MRIKFLANFLAVALVPCAYLSLSVANAQLSSPIAGGVPAAVPAGKGAGVHSPNSPFTVIRKMLRVGDPVHILTLPIDKWEKKQNHWLTIYCAVRSNDEVCAEIYHTQIIKLRGAESKL